MKTLKLLAFLLLISVFGLSQTHTFCPLDGTCTWTAKQNLSLGLGIGSVSLIDPSGANIGNLVLDQFANLNAFSVSANQTSTGDYAIPNVFRVGINPASNTTQFQMALSSEGWRYSSNSKTIGGVQIGSYGSWSDFGSGTITAIYGGSFEGFNAGSATATQVTGVNGNAWCGGVAAGAPVQTPANNGTCTNLRAVQAHAANISSGVVGSAVGVYVNSGTNSGGGSITTLVGVDVTDMTAGGTNYAIRTGLGKVQFGDETHLIGAARLTQGTGASSTSVGSQLIPALSGATGQFGFQVVASTNSSATVQGLGIIARADVAASTTQSTNQSFVAQDAVKGSGAAITNSYGFYANARTSGTNNFGFYSEAGNKHNFSGATIDGTGNAVFPSVSSTTYTTATNCASSGGTCGSAAAGRVSIAAAATTVTVATTAVTAASEIFIQEDSTLGAALSVTCNTTLGRSYAVTTRTAGTSFVITTSAAPVTNPACLSFRILN